MGYLFTAFAIIGTITNTFQKKICFLFWLVSNGYFVAINFLNSDYPQTLLFLFNTATAIMGYVLWKRKEKAATIAVNATKTAEEEICSNTI